MQPLLTFACLAMCVTALGALLPERSPLRKTALLASGLLMAAMWLSSLPQLLPALPSAVLPDTLLDSTSLDSVDTRRQALIQQMQEGLEHGQAASMASP